MQQNDLPLARLIVHRIAGRTAQMGSGKLAAAFREMEIALSQADVMDELKKEKMQSLISGLHFLMKLVDKRMDGSYSIS
jgi:hypothetical protein